MREDIASVEKEKGERYIERDIEREKEEEGGVILCNKGNWVVTGRGGCAFWRERGWGKG